MEKRKFSLSSFPFLPWLVSLMALFFLLYSIVLHYRGSTYSVNLNKIDSFVGFYPELTQFESLNEGNRNILRVTLEPKENSWSGWTIPPIPSIPTHAVLLLDLRISSNLSIISLNIQDKTPIEETNRFAREYWFRNISNHSGELLHLEIPLNSLERNLYQEDPEADNKILDLENGLTMDFSLNPSIHNSQAIVDLYKIEFHWDDNRLPQIILCGMFLLLSLWILYQTGLGFRITQSRYYYNFQTQNLMALLIIIPVFALLPVNSWLWWLMFVGPLLLGVQVLQRMLDKPFLDFHLFIYPFLLLMIPVNWPVYTLIPMGFLFFIPGFFKRFRVQLIALLFFTGYSILWIFRIECEYFGLFALGLILPIIDFLYRQFKRDLNKMDMREMAQTLYESVLNNIVEIVLITHDDGKVMGYNRGFLKWIARSNAIPINTYLADILPAEIEKQWFLQEAPPERIVIERNDKRYHYSIRSYSIEDADNHMTQWFITDITHQQELEIELNKANRELKTLALTDELTGLPNRRHFNHRLIDEWKRAQRKGAPITLVVGDIDYFKQFNDFYGHQKGDEAIIHTARIWKDAARRPYDLAARIGGEEFVLLFPNARPEEILHLLRKIQADLRSNPIAHKKSQLGKELTISMGLSCMIPTENSNWDDLYVLSDAWLYFAKDQGRNRIEWGMEHPPEKDD